MDGDWDWGLVGWYSRGLEVGRVCFRDWRFEEGLKLGLG